MNKVAVAVFASGNGSNLEALLEAQARFSYRVVLVISDNPDAYALHRARRHGVEALCLQPRDYSSRNQHDAALAEACLTRSVKVIALAGYMRMVGEPLLKAYPYRILNIHPALLPSFPGTHGVEDALNYGVKVTGCTVHLVDAGMDTGPIMLQEAVAVADDDTVESLHNKIHQLEHRLYPRALDLVCRGSFKLEGRRCIIHA